ncbi:MAG: type II secretion system protein GspH [Gammaproteobacteria bacterium]|nr:type II secretion system protein GspH [Gammaproteobacteria bacterium]MYD81334.1 type II secretion system protein GspH [Gammaproteobacteria bacterium]
MQTLGLLGTYLVEFSRRKMSAPRRRERGFTLLELLVVLSIIGILATIVVVSFVGSDHHSIVRNEADRMIRTLELARKESMLRNELWGVLLEDDTYEFVYYDFDQSQWLPLDRKPYIESPLEKNLELVFNTPEEVANETSGEEGEVPGIVIEPTGEITPFQIDIRHIDSLVTSSFETDGLSKVTYKIDELAQR